MVKSELLTEKPLPPLPQNPVKEMRIKIATTCELPKKILYQAKPSHCGLGTKQGTQGTYKGIQFDSYWEFAFYLWCTEIQGIVCVRNTTDSFKYRDENDQWAHFYPDFKVNGMFCEIKGIYRVKDMLKKEATLGIVQFYGPEEMKPILREVNKKIPNWRDLYMEGVHKTKLGKKR